MANSVANVLAGKPLASGGVLAAPLDSTQPTDAVTALDAAFLPYGYSADSGVVMTNSRETTAVYAWGGDQVATLQTSHTVTYQVTLIEALNGNAVKAVYGSGNVTATAATSTHGAQLAVAVNATELDHLSWVFEMKNGDRRVRDVIPNGQITAVGDVTYSDGAVIAYPATITCYPDNSGNKVYHYTDDGQTTA